MMPDPSKIALSEKELLMLQDADWILTKQRIIDKVSALLAQMVPVINQKFQHLSMLSDDIRASVPKISKGEQYLGLPYVILDYPRVFNGDDVFALRSMFWWGNFISVTIQLSGRYKRLISVALDSEGVSDPAFFIGINPDPWQHHFKETNYRLAHTMSGAEQACIFEELETLKLALKFDLKDWDAMPHLLATGYDKISKLLSVSYRGDEKDLLPGTPKAGFDL